MITTKSALFLILTVVISQSANAQQLNHGILMPRPSKENAVSMNMSYLPEGGLNLYDKPNGEVIARLGRDRRSTNNLNLLNIFVYPRDRASELIPTIALAPLSNNCFALPFVEYEQNHVLLFSKQETYSYWVSLQELEQAGYYLTSWPEETVNQIIENKAGLIAPDFAKLTDLPRQQFTYVPTGGLPLFDEQQQNVATLSKFCPVGKYTDGHMRMFILPNENPNSCIEVPLEKLHHWSDDAYVIPFYQNRQGFVRLFNDSRLGSTWVRISDITDHNYLLISWKEYFISRRSSPVIVEGNGLVLRESPYADAKRILTIRGEEMQIHLTGFDDGFCEGNWCKVKVKVYNEIPCATQNSEEKNLKAEYEGWIKLIDDTTGLPNVYMNTKGC